MTHQFKGNAAPHPHDYQKPTEDSILRISGVRLSVKVAHDVVVGNCPDNHWRQLALDALDVASAMANKSIVMGQQPEGPKTCIKVFEDEKLFDDKPYVSKAPAAGSPTWHHILRDGVCTKCKQTEPMIIKVQGGMGECHAK